VQLLWKAVWRFVKNLKTQLPYDPVIPLLDIYPKLCAPGYHRATCTLIFIAALVTIAKIWKQPRCPVMMNGLRKCGNYMQNGVLLSHKK
jgi:hypothetical protein